MNNIHYITFNANLEIHKHSSVISNCLLMEIWRDIVI